MLALILLLGSPPALADADPIGVGAAVAELRAAVVSLDGTFNALPPAARELLAADVKLLGQTIDSTLARIEQPAVPLVDETVVHDLAFLTDIMTALAAELESGAAELESGALAGGDAHGRIEGLSQLAASRLDQLNETTDLWLARTRASVLEVDNADGTIIVRAIDRVLYAAIRYAGVGLLLIGMLLVGLQLLRAAGENEDRPRPSTAPIGAAIGLGTLALFFLGALGMTLFPSSLAGLSAAREVLPQEHPCQRLGAQRARLRLAQNLDHGELVEASKQRMLPAATDCLGMPNALAAAGAVEQLALRTPTGRASGWDRVTAASTGASTAAAAAGVGGPDVAKAPAAGDMAQEDITQDMTEDSGAAPTGADALGALLASLRQAEGELAASGEPAPDPAAGEPDAQVPALPAALASPADAPPPAAGPAVTRPVAAPPAPEPQRYLVTAGLNYREAPSTDARRLGVLRPGSRITVLALDDGWAEIELDDGRRAYASSEFLRPPN